MTARLFSLSRVRLTKDGYDVNGRYWGTGAPLYRAHSDTSADRRESLPHVELNNRARTRQEAKEAVRVDYPQARFFR